jgi:hypothetical protein
MSFLAGRRTRVALLMVTLSALLPTITGVTAQAQPTVPGGLGYDISWPQCGRVLPNDGIGVAVIGVTGGSPFTANPCLRSEAAWARGAALPYDLYMNLNWPTAATAGEAANGPRGHCAPGDVTCLGYNYGYNAVASATGVAGAAGASAATWWLDVETGDYWSSNTTGNTAVVQGAIDGLHGRGITAGIYSISFMWQQITNGYQAPSIPVWIPGPQSIDYAHYYCDQRFSFDGGPVWLVQYPRSGLDGDMICTTQPSWPPTETWHGVAYLGSGPLGGPPSAVAPLPWVVDVFWRGTDSALWHTWRYNGSWYGPQSLGGQLASDPSVVSPSPGVIDVFWKGVDGGLWHKWFNSYGWQGPAGLGGALATSPQAVAPGNAIVDVFWRANDGSLTHAWYNQGWNAPQALAAGSTGDGQPFPVSSNPGLVDVFWRGADANLWHAFYNQAWYALSSLGFGPLGSDPHAVGWLNGHIEVTWTGTDGGLWEGVYGPGVGWLGPRSLVARGLGSDPVPLSWGLGDTDVYWLGTDGNLWHHWYGRSESLGDGPLGSRPSAVTGSEGAVTVVWRGTDNNLWMDWYG